jgi:hypothetical protein
MLQVEHPQPRVENIEVGNVFPIQILESSANEEFQHNCVLGGIKGPMLTEDVAVVLDLERSPNPAHHNVLWARMVCYCSVCYKNGQ